MNAPKNKDYLWDSIQPIARGEALDERVMEFALLLSRADARSVVEFYRRDSEDVVARLDRVYYFLKNHIKQDDCEKTQAFYLGRIASLLELAIGTMYKNQMDILRNDGWQFEEKLEVMRALASGPKSEAELRDLLPEATNNYPLYLDTLKELRITGHIAGNHNNHQLTYKGFETLMERYDLVPKKQDL
jgi:hypothetical protein